MEVAKEQVISLYSHLCLEWRSTDQVLTWRPVSLLNSKLTDQSVASTEMFSSSSLYQKRGKHLLVYPGVMFPSQLINKNPCLMQSQSHDPKKLMQYPIPRKAVVRW